MSNERSMEITEREMHGAIKDIPKEETYNSYGGTAGKVEISALEEHDTFIRVPQGGPNGRCVYKRHVCLYHKTQSFESRS